MDKKKQLNTSICGIFGGLLLAVIMFFSIPELFGGFESGSRFGLMYAVFGVSFWFITSLGLICAPCVVKYRKNQSKIKWQCRAIFNKTGFYYFGQFYQLGNSIFDQMAGAFNVIKASIFKRNYEKTKREMIILQFTLEKEIKGKTNQKITVDVNILVPTDKYEHAVKIMHEIASPFTSNITNLIKQNV